MLHPILARALATAQVEERHRAAARRHTIRLARRVAHKGHVAATRTAPRFGQTEVDQSSRPPSLAVTDIRHAPRDAA